MLWIVLYRYVMVIRKACSNYCLKFFIDIVCFECGSIRNEMDKGTGTLILEKYQIDNKKWPYWIESN